MQRRPLLPQRDKAFSDRQLVLVIDIDETLAYARKGNLCLRPYAAELVRHAAGICEVVLWTAGTPEYAEFVRDTLALEARVATPVHHLVSRDTGCWYSEASLIKDLRLLGRGLDRVLMVENTPQCAVMNPGNAIIVPSWEGDVDHCAALHHVRLIVEELAACDLAVAEFLRRCTRLEQHACPDPFGEVFFYLPPVLTPAAQAALEHTPRTPNALPRTPASSPPLAAR